MCLRAEKPWLIGKNLTCLRRTLRASLFLSSSSSKTTPPYNLQYKAFTALKSGPLHCWSSPSPSLTSVPMFTCLASCRASLPRPMTSCNGFFNRKSCSVLLHRFNSFCSTTDVVECTQEVYCVTSIIPQDVQRVVARDASNFDAICVGYWHTKIYEGEFV